MPDDPEKPVPDALLLLASGCPHCPRVLQSLADMVKEGAIGQLEVVNVGQRPERARELGVRSVPWIRIGGFVLEGLHSRAELQEWADRVGQDAGQSDYFQQQLATGGLKQVLAAVEADGALLGPLIALLERDDIDINIRLGIGAVMESMEGTEALQAAVPQLARLTESEDARVRGDACYYLSLSHAPAARRYVEPLAQDTDAGVQDIAREALETLNALART